MMGRGHGGREPNREQAVEHRLIVPTIGVLLALGACDPQAAKGAPPAAAQGQVNPDAGVMTYRCVDGGSVVAGYPDSKTAVVTWRDHAYTLKAAPSTKGRRYTGYGLQWQVEGDHAVITALKPGEEAATASGLACTAQPQSAAATKT
jgi:hypothetical protein